jgi:hypothetical protein
MDRRVIYSDNETLSDFSTELITYGSGTESFTFAEAEDYLYIGQRVPFNHLYFKVDSGNTNVSAIDIDYWDGNNWINTVEKIDETVVSGKSLAQSGFITWTTNKDNIWSYDSTNYGGSTVTGLENVTIYDLFWLRLDFSASLSEVSLAWLGQIFCSDDDIKAEYPDLMRSRVLTAFESGKTDWEEQRVAASKMVTKDLQSKAFIRESGQIVERRELELMTVSRTAWIIYNGLGNDYEDQRDKAMKEYRDRLDSYAPVMKVDQNMDGRFDNDEYPTIGRLRR